MQQKAKTVGKTAVEAISLSEAKAWVRIPSFDTTQDTLISTLCATAVETVETILNWHINKHDKEFYLDSFQEIIIDDLPFREIEEIVYLNEAGEEQVLDSSKYQVTALDELLAKVQFANDLPLLYKNEGFATAKYNTITVRYSVGYLNANEIPKDFKIAMLLLLTHWYDNRANTKSEYPSLVDRFLAQYRKHNF